MLLSLSTSFDPGDQPLGHPYVRGPPHRPQSEVELRSLLLEAREEGREMPYYMLQAAYAPEAWKALVKSVPSAVGGRA